MLGLEKLIKVDRPEEHGQIYFHDDDSFEYRKLLIEDSLLKQKDGSGTTIACWALLFSLRKKFSGYKDAPRGPVILSYSRDVVLDPFNQAQNLNGKVGGKLADKGNEAFLTKVAERQTNQLSEIIQPRQIFDKFMIFLCCLIGVLGVFLGVKFLT